MARVRVSVVIPCFNQGQYLNDAVASVLSQSFDDLEIIIVNDGSTSRVTQEILADYKQNKTRIIHTSNQGLASARNNGIRQAKGEYILPLDADDRIGEGYIKNAVNLLDEHQRLGIVYCQAQLFGAVETKWQLPEFSLERMLLDNIIFCSALFRRCDWGAVGGYDPEMTYGWEDYDFWLSLIELGREVYQIPEVFFFYRVASNSMVRSKERWQKIAMFKRIFQRHKELFSDNIGVWIDALLEVQEPYYTSKLYINTGGGVSDEECISRKVDIGTSEIQFSVCEYQQIKAIRFDPVDTPAIIEVFRILVSTQQGDNGKTVVYENNSIFQVNNDCYFGNNDPQYFLCLTESELKNIDTIIVHLSFKALASDALQQIVEFQQGKLHELEEYRSLGIIEAAGNALRKKEGESRMEYLNRQLKLF